EDATVEWSEADSPYVPIATIHYPPQTAHSAALQRFGDDRLTFNSWRGIDEHRPLGGINRLKLRVYEQYSIFRHEANKEDYLEPKDLSGWPE
ncbi:catalase, partial [Mycobacterium sp. ITM-2017-0098]